MRWWVVALMMIGASAEAGGGRRGEFNFGPYRWSPGFSTWNVHGGRSRFGVSPYYVNPYLYWNPYAYAWYPQQTVNLDDLAVNRPNPEPVVEQAPAPPQQPVVIVLQDARPAPAPAPEPVVVPVPVPTPAPVAAPAAVAAPEPAKPQTPGPDVYVWTDDEGTMHYSTLVPPEYRAKAKKLATLNR